MSRVVGTETEYVIATPELPEYSPIISSTHAVVAYAALHTGARSRWDFAEEHPLRDSRGFDLKRYHTVPVVDPNAIGVANVVTANGARFYVDHAHPEYSAPECTNAWDATLYDAAGDATLLQAAASVAGLSAQGKSVLANHDPCPALRFYKNNVDGKGASYGSHENYQYSRATDFGTMAQALIPFFVARQVVIGAGRMGIGEFGEEPGIQISQRADYIEQEISLETTLNRGIINTRDEPHSNADEWKRLHVIIGDANLSEYSQFLKVGTTSLVLDAIEAGVDFSDLALESPVDDVYRISRDLTCTATLRGEDRKTQRTAIDIQRIYRDRVMDAADREAISLSDVEKKVIEVWGEILDDLESDPLSTADRLDWTAKYALLDGFRQRGTGEWDDPRLALIDLQYSDCDPKKGLYYALVRRGKIRTLVDPDDVTAAIDTPPTDTRAWLRGRLVDRFSSEVIAANWDNLIVTPAHPQRIDLSSPTAANATTTYDITESAQNIDDVTRYLTSSGVCDVTPLPSP